MKLWQTLIILLAIGFANSQHFKPIAPNPEDFDIGSDHSILYGIDYFVKTIYKHISHDASNVAVVTFVKTYVTMCWFDSLAPYYPKATPVTVDIPKRPKSEHTELNRNIALTHATYHCLNGIVPESKDLVDEMIMKVLGDDYDLEIEDITRPHGIGNIVGRKISEIANSNGMNSLGDFGGKVKYNRKPYAPTVMHRPVNSPYDVKMRDPSRWQPALVKSSNGQGYVAQTFITPQLRFLEPLLMKNLSEFHVKPHGRMNPWSNLYKETTDEVINEVAKLTERRKIAGEMFNDKIAILSPIWQWDVKNLKIKKLSQLQAAGFHLSMDLAIHDALIVVWKEKVRYDAVRPFSAVRSIYPNDKIKGYASPELGIVDDMPGHEWTSYLAVSDHPEYPSATATVCGVIGEISQLFSKFAHPIQIEFPMDKGSSQREPKRTPKENTGLKYNTWGQFAEECAMSRFWTGVHFKDSCTEGLQLGRQFAEMAHQKIVYHLGEKF